jgi:chemotaxis protein MotB
MLMRGNHRDRWLLTYSDFITLLFATFVLMYATAKAKEQKAPVHNPPVAATAAPVTATAAVEAKPAPPVSNLLRELRNSLQSEQQDGAATISTEQRGIVISLDDRMCFKPGQADLQAAVVSMFEKVANTLSRYDNRILLEGHTDSVPVHNGQFRNNWQLSTARSLAVLELMERSAAIAPERFLIGGSADNAPVSSNETEQGRARNRRVDIIVLEGLAPPAESKEAAHPMAFALTAGPAQSEPGK